MDLLFYILNATSSALDIRWRLSRTCWTFVSTWNIWKNIVERGMGCVNLLWGHWSVWAGSKRCVRTRRRSDLPRSERFFVGFLMWWTFKYKHLWLSYIHNCSTNLIVWNITWVTLIGQIVVCNIRETRNKIFLRIEGLLMEWVRSWC